jgi:ribosomal protein S18 acetylase RimI-like enzyme
MTGSFGPSQADRLSCHADEAQIGPAITLDSNALAQLFRISSDGTSQDIWVKAASPGECLLQAGSRLHASAEGVLSFTNALVAKRAGTVMGMILGCSIVDLLDSREMIQPLLPSGLGLDQPHNVIVLGLAVFPEYRNQRIASRLLTALERRTSFLETGRIGVICPYGSDAARVFLERRSYRELVGQSNGGSGPLMLMYKSFFEELPSSIR